MIEILPIKPATSALIQKHQLKRKFDKKTKLFSQNQQHPSLNVELLEPKQYGIYSFRIDLKYRALFIFRPDKNAIEILNITVHYH